jgi:hypothetical protein
MLSFGRLVDMLLLDDNADFAVEKLGNPSGSRLLSGKLGPCVIVRV